LDWVILGIDGIKAEHQKNAIETSVITHLNLMFTLCIRFGVVPASLGKGLLIPLLKKSRSDPSIPAAYYATISTLLELFILDVVRFHEFSQLQFGFIPDRRSQMAVSLTSDVISHILGSICVSIPAMIV